MKPQDILFIVLLAALIWKRNTRWIFIAGILSFFLSIPFFAFWIFFTAQRLVYYGVGFLSVGILFELLSWRKNTKD